LKCSKSRSFTPLFYAWTHAFRSRCPIGCTFAEESYGTRNRARCSFFSCSRTTTFRSAIGNPGAHTIQCSFAIHVLGNDKMNQNKTAYRKRQANPTSLWAGRRGHNGGKIHSVHIEINYYVRGKSEISTWDLDDRAYIVSDQLFHNGALTTMSGSRSANKKLSTMECNCWCGGTIKSHFVEMNSMKIDFDCTRAYWYRKRENIKL
jgi:hypothetical protein